MSKNGAIKAWHSEILVYCDGPQLCILKGNDDDFYLSMMLDNDKCLCIPISKETIDEYRDSWTKYLELYKQSEKFYISTYEDWFPDAETHYLKEIPRSEIKDEWWPGE